MMSFKETVVKLGNLPGVAQGEVPPTGARQVHIIVERGHQRDVTEKETAMEVPQESLRGVPLHIPGDEGKGTDIDEMKVTGQGIEFGINLNTKADIAEIAPRDSILMDVKDPHHLPEEENLPPQDSKKVLLLGVKNQRIQVFLVIRH